jgi:PAP2 superfamily
VTVPDEVATTANPPQAARRDRWRVARSILGVAYVVAAIVQIRTWGVPLERPILLTWLMVAGAIFTLGRGGGGALNALKDWLPYGVAMTAYDYSRGAADQLGMPLQEDLLINVDKFLFFGHVPNVVLQDWLGPFDKFDPAWWQVPMALMYATHFVVPFVIPAVLWIRNRERFREWRRRFFSVVGLGLITYCLLPAVPPWLASKNGKIGEIERIVNYGWRRIGVDIADRVFDLGSRTFNVVAALPSLHAAFSLVATAYFWNRASKWVRPILVLYPLGMALTLVIGGEHYVFDILLGWFYVLIVEIFWTRREARRRALDGGQDLAPDPVAQAQSPA